MNPEMNLGRHRPECLKNKGSGKRSRVSVLRVIGATLPGRVFEGSPAARLGSVDPVRSVPPRAADLCGGVPFSPLLISHPFPSIRSSWKDITHTSRLSWSRILAASSDFRPMRSLRWRFASNGGRFDSGTHGIWIRFRKKFAMMRMIGGCCGGASVAPVEWEFPLLSFPFPPTD